MNDSTVRHFNACLTDYLREVVCECPRCGGRATIRATSRYAWFWSPSDVAFLCPSCVHRQGWPSPGWSSNFQGFNPAEGREPYFGYQL